MKRKLCSLPALALALTVTFTACKKEAQKPTEDNTTEVKAHAEDQNMVSGELDDIANDANIALESNISISGKVSGTTDVTNVTGVICNATTVVDTISNPRTITITYSGNNCVNSHSRTGVVILSMAANTRWKNAGAAITVAFQNLKIKRLSDNKSITINGSQTLTNVSGGLLINLANLQSIVHTITSSNMSITFDDNSQRTWQIARKRTFTYSNGANVSITGIGITGNTTNAAEWGTNRFGHTFVTSITQPLVFRQDCSGRLTSGEITHQGFATATVTFGLNASGVATVCPGIGVYYYKLVWTGPGGNSFSAILPY